MILNKNLTSEEFFLSLNQVIVLSPENMFDNAMDDSRTIADGLCCCWDSCFGWRNSIPWGQRFNSFWRGLFYGCVFCGLCGKCIVPPYCCGRSRFYYPLSRIGTSLVEWIIIVMFGYFIDRKDNNYLFDFDHGLGFFITSFACFIIYTFHQKLMPNIRLPNNVPVRSKFGYAFLGQITELERIKIPQKFEESLETQGVFWDENRSLTNFEEFVYCFSRKTPVDDRLNEKETNWLALCLDQFGWSICRLVNNVNSDQVMDDLWKKYNSVQIPTQARGVRFSKLTKSQWDTQMKCISEKPYRFITSMAPAALYALSNEQYRVVQWLEQRGAVKHKIMIDKEIELNGRNEKQDYQLARLLVSPRMTGYKW